MTSSNSRYTSSSGSSSSASQSLLIDVRASTQGFSQDIAAMSQSVTGTLTPGFTQAGNALQTSLSAAIASGIAGFTPYVVGERGPELFVPTSAGSIANGQGGGASRDVRVSININSPGSDAPQAMQRSSRQVASAVRRALSQN